MSAATRRDWKATTFSLSVTDVAAVLGVPPESVVDLMTVGALGFWIPPAPPGGRDGLPVTAARFDPADVYAWRDARPKADLKAYTAVLDNLRAYLDAHWPPVRDYGTALSGNRPLSVRSRAYVRIEALTGFAREHDAPPAAHLAGVTERVLTSVGAVKQRGIRPDGEREQRWAYWVRLPDSMWNGDAPRSLRDFLTTTPPGPLPGGVPKPDGLAPPLPTEGDVWADGWEE